MEFGKEMHMIEEASIYYLPDSVDKQPFGPFVCGHSQRVVQIVPFDVVSPPLVHSSRILVYFVWLEGDSNTLDAHFGHNAVEVHAVVPVDSDSFAVESCHSSCLAVTDIAFSEDLVDTTSHAVDMHWVQLVPAFVVVVA